MILKIKNNEFLKDILVTFSGQTIVLLTNFIINKMMSIFVGVSGFGIFNIAKRSATVIGYIVLLELGISIPRYFAMYKNSNRRVAYEYYQVGIILMTVSSFFCIIIGVFFTPFLAKILFGSVVYRKLIMPMLLFAIGICFNTFCYSAYRGAELFYLYSMIQIGMQSINIIVIYFFRSTGVSNILLYWGLSNIIFSIPLFILFSKLNNMNLFMKIISWRKKARELLIYGIPRILGDIVQFSYYLLPLIFVNNRFGKISSGVFSASTGILQSFLPFFSYIGIILLPKVSQSLVNHSFVKIQVEIRKLMVIYLAFSILAIVCGFIFAKPLMIILYNSNYLKNILVAKILLLTLLPRSQFLLLRNPIDAISIKPYNTWNLLISVVIMALIIIFSKSIFMVAWAFVISDITLFILSYFSWQILIRKKNDDQ